VGSLMRWGLPPMNGAVSTRKGGGLPFKLRSGSLIASRASGRRQSVGVVTGKAFLLSYGEARVLSEALTQ
jgi:hypothetical protein